MLNQSKLHPTLSYADNQGLFEQLEKIYNRLPETVCNKCATCCMVPTPGYLIEYLYAYKYLRDNLKDEQVKIMERVIRYFYLELVDPSIKCPFLSDNNDCQIYPARPLSCRLHGFLSRKDFNKASKRKLDTIAERYRVQHGIEIPREIMDFEIPYCDNVRLKDGSKKRVSIMLVQSMATDLENLEYQIMPQEVIEQQYTFVPVPTHLALSVLSEGARIRRPRIMKEYMEHGSSELFNEYVTKFSNYKF